MLKAVIIFAVIVVVGFFLLPRTKTTTTWRNDTIVIRYKSKPPHFRNIHAKDVFDEFSSCGYCDFYKAGTGCTKYGVTYSGVGSVVKTVCDDFKSSLFSGADS